MRSVKDVQSALSARGFNPGPIDNIMGRLTRGALERFQAANGLKVTGVADDATLAALFPGKVNSPASAVSLPWYLEAIRLTGVAEVVGKQNSATIMGWAKRLGGFVAKVFTSDEVAWCGLFVAHCVSSTLPNEPLPDNPLGARNWMKFGKPLSRPAKGAVAVFWRGSKTGWQGHVGFVEAVAADGSAVLVRGGNQSNKVSLSWLSTDRLLGYRWPSSAPAPVTGIPVSTVGGKLSTNEA